MIEKSKIERISHQVIKTLFSRFEKFPEDASEIRNAPFHMAFLEAFKTKLEDKVTNIPVFISLANWFHGLNTSVGQSFFESTAHILSDGVKKEFRSMKISSEQQTVIADIISDLKNGARLPNLDQENNLIFSQNSNLSKEVPNFSADCYFEENNKIVAIELKTVKPNSSIFKSEKEKLLFGKASLQNLYPNKKIYFYLGFPFDPQSDTPTGYDKESFLNYSVEFKKYFESNEVLLASELWDFLSGTTKTMEQILAIINRIASVEFLEKYTFINNRLNLFSQREKYLNQLSEWNLFSEIYFVKNERKLLNEIEKNNRLERTLNQSVFTKDGEYNVTRCGKLLEVIQS